MDRVKVTNSYIIYSYILQGTVLITQPSVDVWILTKPILPMEAGMDPVGWTHPGTFNEQDLEGMTSFLLTSTGQNSVTCTYQLQGMLGDVPSGNWKWDEPMVGQLVCSSVSVSFFSPLSPLFSFSAAITGVHNHVDFLGLFP